VAAEADQVAHGRRPARAVAARVARLDVPFVVCLWLGLGLALSAVTTRVVDWFVMTDELLYERLGISVARLHSPLPRVHGQLIPSLNQLYPVLIAPVFAHAYVPNALPDAHQLNAFVMSSAAIPAFLLTRRVTGRRAASYLVAALSVCLPWIVFSAFLLTEVAAYPAFLWALLAFQRAVVEPSRRNDVVALLGLGLALAARTQFVVLGIVLPLTILVYERRRALERHRVLAWAYIVLAAGVVALLVVGRLASTLGTYGGTISGNLLPSDSGRSLLEHVAVLALGLGILPFVVGAAWLLANVARQDAGEARAFAVLGVVAVAALLLEVTLFDLRFGNGLVRDRYLFYAAPVVLIGFAAALCDRRLPRWSLLPTAAVVVIGFAVAKLPAFEKLSIDTPVSTLDNYLLRTAHSLTGARLTLVVSTVLLCVVFVQAAALLPRNVLAIGLGLLTLGALTAETSYAFVRLFRVDGTSGRPLTLAQGTVFDWIDRWALSPDADVTMIPYPMVPGDYWASVAYWWDLEFWNKSVDRAAYYPKQYEWTPSTFPKLYLRFDPQTGLADRSPTEFVAQSAKETRFRVSGTIRYADRDALVIDAGRQWRADWLSFGLDDDGWTRPGRVARIRVFAGPHQDHPLIRTLALWVRAPVGVSARPFTVSSDAATWRGQATDAGTAAGSVQLCVPAHGYADVLVRASGASPIYGDMRDQYSYATPRRAGVFLSEIALADELGPACRAKAEAAGR
jgi:hypothetical protein